MSELDRQSRAVLDSLMSGERLSDAERGRLRAGFASRVGAGVFAGSLTTAAASVAASGGGSAAVVTTGIGIKKLILVLALVGAVGGGTTYAIHTSHKNAPVVPATEAVVQARPPDSPMPIAVAPPTATEEVQAPISIKAKIFTPKTAAAPPSAPSGGAIEDEIELMARAQNALRTGDSRGALTFLDQHAARFPKGQMAEEREAFRIFALCAIDKDGARAKATRFLRAHPNSPVLGRIRKECGIL